MIPQSNATGTVVRNALEDAEYTQALDVVSFKGGEFVGAPTPKFPGIDGWLDGVPTQLKQTQGPSSVFGIQRNIVGAANDMAKQNYVGDVFVDASGSSVSMQQLLDFTAPGRPISNVLNEGTVNNVYVKLPDGWLNLTKGRLTSSGN